MDTIWQRRQPFTVRSEDICCFANSSTRLLCRAKGISRERLQHATFLRRALPEAIHKLEAELTFRWSFVDESSRVSRRRANISRGGHAVSLPTRHLFSGGRQPGSGPDWCRSPQSGADSSGTDGTCAYSTPTAQSTGSDWTAVSPTSTTPSADNATPSRYIARNI